MNIQEYNRKVIAILSDVTKFEIISFDPFSFALKLLDIVKIFLMKLKKIGMITEIIYKNFYANG